MNLKLNLIPGILTYVLAMICFCALFSSCKVKEDGNKINQGTLQNSTLYFGSHPLPKDTDIHIVYGNNYKGPDRITHGTLLYKVANGLPYTLQDFNLQFVYRKADSLALPDKLNRPLGGASQAVRRESEIGGDTDVDIINYRIDALNNYQDITYLDRINLPNGHGIYEFDIICTAKNHAPDNYHFHLSRMEADSKMDLIKKYVNKVLNSYPENERAKIHSLVSFNRINESTNINLEFVDTRGIYSIIYDARQNVYVVKDFQNNIVDALN